MVDCVAEYLSSIGSLRINVFPSNAKTTKRLQVKSLLFQDGIPSGGSGGRGGGGSSNGSGELRLRLVFENENESERAVDESCKINLKLGQHLINCREGYFEVKGRVETDDSGKQGGNANRYKTQDVVDNRVLCEEQSLKRYAREHGEVKLRCAQCYAPCSRGFTAVGRLPHSSWVESAAQWFCSCSGTENSLLYLEQVEDNLQPAPGKCLLGETVCILSSEDYHLDASEKDVAKTRSSSDERSQGVFHCKTCGQALGLIGPWPSTHGTTKCQEALTLFKYAIRMDRKDRSCDDVFAPYTPCNSLTQDLLLSCQATQQMKYQVRVAEVGGLEKSNRACLMMVQLVILNQRVVLGHVHIGGETLEEREREYSRWSGPCMKVLYKIIGGEEGRSLSKDAIEACDSWASTTGANCISVPQRVGFDLISCLAESTEQLLPPNCASFDNFQIGYLEIVDRTCGVSSIIE